MRKRRSVGKSPHVGRDYLRPHEANALIEAADRVGRRRLRDQVLPRLMYRHGLRVSEAKYTKWTDFDLTAGRDRRPSTSAGSRARTTACIPWTGTKYRHCAS
jgi:integrase